MAETMADIGAPADDRLAAVNAVAGALRRESHVIGERPELLWQQLYNRLQWDEGSISTLLPGRFAQRAAPGSPPWFHTLTPIRESRSLVRTLEPRVKRRDGVFSVSVACIDFSPDGRLLASVCGDDTLRIWDVDEGREVVSLAGAEFDVAACAFSRDGKRLLSGGEDRTSREEVLKVWDLATKKELLTLEGHGKFSSCSFSPDERFIVAITDGPRLYDAERGIELRMLGGTTVSWNGTLVGSAERTCAVSPNGHRVVAGWHDGTLRVVDLDSANEVCALIRPTRSHAQDMVRCCSFSPDGRRIISGHADATVQLWDAESGECLCSFNGHDTGGWVNGALINGVYGCAFSPDGRLIVSAGGDMTLKVWDAESGCELGTLTGHAAPLKACAFSPDGRIVASTSYDNTIKLWDVMSLASGPDSDAPRTIGTAVQSGVSSIRVATGPLIFAGQAGGQVKACAFSPDGRTVASGGGDGCVRLWDASDGSELHLLEGHMSWVTACAFSPDGRRLVSSSMGAQGQYGEKDLGRMLKVWDADTGTELCNLAGHSAHVFSCAFSPDGRTIASASDDNTVRLWDASDGHELRVFEGTDRTCAFSPDGRIIAAYRGLWEEGQLTLWEVRSGRQVAAFPSTRYSGGPGYVFSPDGRFVVSAGRGGGADWALQVKVWDSSSGTQLMGLAGPAVSVEACAISPDGRFIVSAGGDKTAMLWDTRSAQQLRVIPLASKENCIALHPFKPLAVYGDDIGGLQVLDLLGVQYGPILVTAHEMGGKLNASCPVCRRQLPLKKSQLGHELACADPSCVCRMRLNSFIVRDS